MSDEDVAAVKSMLEDCEEWLDQAESESLRSRLRDVRHQEAAGGSESMESGSTLGASQSLIGGDWEWPLHALRHPPTPGTSGWYIWTGELTGADDFFKPWHVSHLIARLPELERLLDLPPGTRFVFAPDYEDVWHDEGLLDV